MRKYSCYEKYKPSNIDWLGEIPEHWDCWKISHGYSEMGSGTTPTSDNDAYYDGNINWVTTSELRENIIVDTAKKVSQDAMRDFSALKKYPSETLLIAMYGATIGRLGILGVEATINQACCALVKSKVFFNPFLFYWFQAYKKTVIILASGGGQPNISQEKIRSLILPTPPFYEQQKIADFLDRETAKIDSLIQKRNDLIRLLQEKRSAMISHAVTKGIDPTVRLKPSNIDWLGEIPEHWETQKIKYMFSSCNGGTPDTSNPDYWDGTIPWVSAKDMKTNKLYDTEDHITELGLKESSTKYIAPGQVLLVVRSGILKHTIPVAVNIVPVAINQDIKALRPINNLLSEFLCYFIIGCQTSLLAIWSKQSCTVESIEDKYLTETYVPFISCEEQKKIIDFLDRETAKIDSLIQKEKQIIEKIKEYRTALISAAVTGKIDVKGEENA